MVSERGKTGTGHGRGGKGRGDGGKGRGDGGKGRGGRALTMINCPLFPSSVSLNVVLLWRACGVVGVLCGL